MGGVAALARSAGHTVTGSDNNVYPPMSTQLEALGIAISAGDDPGQLTPAPDCIVVGNVMSRGHPLVEAMLERKLPYCSGPEWLSDHVLAGRRVVACAGTHGKTTTASMAAWLLEAAGRDPGFLIGGVPANFGVSARAGTGPFVVEADEYDTAFFDKRAKFVHYRPDIAVLNNLEFDHADIYSNLGEIQRQFHHLVRTVPGTGRLIVNAASQPLAEVLEQGAWTPVEYFADGGGEADLTVDYGAGDDQLIIRCGEQRLTAHSAEISGRHGLQNLAAALLAVRAAGVPIADAAAGIAAFQGVRRRLERLGRFGELTVYDDFAHHPTAIRATLAGLRHRHARSRLLVALELRSNTMRLGTQAGELADSLGEADLAYVFRPADTGFDAEATLAAPGHRVRVFSDYRQLEDAVLADVRIDGDTLVLMSNGAFGGLRESLPQRLAGAPAASPKP